MEKMFQAYKDLAEFRLVYINEAHAADSDWSVSYAEELGITEHDDYGERCSVANMLLTHKQLTIPCVVDDMRDAVNQAYRAWPDRIFVVRTDGRLAVAAAREPFGFAPALGATQVWLKKLRETGHEPPLPEDAAEAGEERHVTSEEEVKAENAASVLPARTISHSVRRVGKCRRARVVRL